MVLVATLMTMMLLAVLGSALSMLAGMEARISGNYRAGSVAVYAAEAAAEAAVDELRSLPDWAPAIDGRSSSALVFGESSGTRQTAAGPIDLTDATDMPGWQLYARGDLRDVLRLDDVDSASYVVVWVAPVPGAGPDRLAVLAHAHGPAGIRRAVEVRVARDGPPPGLRRLSWREIR